MTDVFHWRYCAVSDPLGEGWLGLATMVRKDGGETVLHTVDAVGNMETYPSPEEALASIQRILKVVGRFSEHLDRISKRQAGREARDLRDEGEDPEPPEAFGGDEPPF